MISFTKNSDNFGTITASRGDGTTVEIDVQIVGIAENTLKVGVWPIGRTTTCKPKEIRQTVFNTELYFDLGEDKRNG